MIGYDRETQEDVLHICHHVLEFDDPDYYQFFTGIGVQFHIICYSCYRDATLMSASLRIVEHEIFHQYLSNIETIFDWEGATGDPEILISDDLLLDSTEVEIHDNPERYKIIRVTNDMDSNRCLAIVQDVLYHRLEFVRYLLVRFSTTSNELLCELSDDRNLNLEGIDFSKELIVFYSSMNTLIVIANRQGQFASVIKEDGTLLTRIDRGTYHIEHSTFPLALLSYSGCLILLHGTDWNRVDLLNLETLERMTEREDPDHYNYFHSRIYISPDNTWIVSNGWIWAPVGVITYWRLDAWVDNPQASEQAPHVQSFIGREKWDTGVCWYNDKMILLQGYGSMDSFYHGATLVDLSKEEVIGWFPGPEGLFDYHHLSGLLVDYDRNSLRLWNLMSGTRVSEKENISFQTLQDNLLYFIEDGKLKYYNLNPPNLS